ncbi:MAG: hypothetical protein JJE03_04580 [Peptostreptococcaceae bacterium]|nr:hypothetical protein [Peptostreptococcaceae bacterium]
MQMYYNSQNETYKTPFGAISVGTAVGFFIRVDTIHSDDKCYLVFFDQEKEYKRTEMKAVVGVKEKTGFYTTMKFDEVNLYFYYFELVTSQESIYYGDNEMLLGGEGKTYKSNLKKYQMIVHMDEKVANWYKEGLIYQIFPDRFNRGDNWYECQKNAELKEDFEGTPRIIMQSWNDLAFYPKDSHGAVTRWPFFGGNLNGIKDKLFYLKSLGISVIYLNPIFSALSNHKYDTWDYMEIDKAFGTNEDFAGLCEEAEYMGIKIILDGVFNHVGAESPYFDRNNNFETIGACQGEKSPYYKWFTFTEFPQKYIGWWGMGDLPEVNEKPSFINYIYDVIVHWMKLGASGFRLDVADELSDEFIEVIRSAAKSVKKDAIILGEVWEDASNKISYGKSRKYFLGKELDSTMNYIFRNEAISYVMGEKGSAEFSQKMYDIYEEYPKENFFSAMNLIGSHDKCRILTLLGEAPKNLSEVEKETYKLSAEKKELANKRLKILIALQFAMPGVPSIYYGDEAGAEGYEDPFNRGTYPWGMEDSETVKHYKTLGSIRRNYKVMRTGGFVSESIDDRILCIRRFDNKTSVAVITVINASETMSKVARVHVGDDKLLAVDLLKSENIVVKDDYIKLKLQPLSFQIIYVARALQNDEENIDCAEYSELMDVFNYFSLKNNTKEWQKWPDKDRDIKRALKLKPLHQNVEVSDTLDFFVPFNSFETWAYRKAFILNENGYPLTKDRYPAYNLEECYDLFKNRFAYVAKHNSKVVLNEIEKYISYEVTNLKGEKYEIPGPDRKLFEITGALPIYAKKPDLTNVAISNLIKTTSLKAI